MKNSGIFLRFEHIEKCCVEAESRCMHLFRACAVMRCMAPHRGRCAPSNSVRARAIKSRFKCPLCDSHCDLLYRDANAIHFGAIPADSAHVKLLCFDPARA